MTEGKYLIAGLKVKITAAGSMTLGRAEKYRYDFEGEPDMSVAAEPDVMRKLHLKLPSLDIATAEYMSTAYSFYRNLARFDGFMLHSSAVCYGGKAYLFTADSGTGKSTHTSLWMRYLDGVSVINDDKPAVRLISGVFYAAGTPWSGKNDSSSIESIPIGAVSLLYRSKTNEIAPVDSKKAVLTVLRQTSMPDELALTDRFGDLADKFIRSVPIFDFGCDISEQAVITSFEAMTGEKYIKRK